MFKREYFIPSQDLKKGKCFALTQSFPFISVSVSVLSVSLFLHPDAGYFMPCESTTFFQGCSSQETVTLGNLDYLLSKILTPLSFPSMLKLTFYFVLFLTHSHQYSGFAPGSVLENQFQYNLWFQDVQRFIPGLLNAKKALIL